MPGPDHSTLLTATGLAAVAGGLLTGSALSLLHPRANIFGPIVWRGPSTRTSVALTFDDGPEPRHTDRIARILDAHGVKATFFCIGQKVALHRATAAALVHSGHELDNHTYSHGLGRHLFSATRLREDLQRCQDVLESLSGRVPTYYRPAVGLRNPPVHSAARYLKLTIVTWTHSARDGALAFTPRRALKLADRAVAGNILALHDGQLHGRASLREETVRHLPLLLTRLRERGFKFETLTELLSG